MIGKKGVAPIVIVIVLIAVALLVWYGASSEEGEEGLGSMFSLFGDEDIDYSDEYEESVDTAITCKDDHDCFVKKACSEYQNAFCKVADENNPGGYCYCVDKGGFGNEVPEVDLEDPMEEEALVNNAGCIEDKDCKDPDNPYCVDSICESSLLGAGCLKDEDCKPTQSLECGAGGNCVLKQNRCLTDKDCPANSPACNKDNGECTLCLASGDKTDGTNSYCKNVNANEPYCLSAAPACHECIEEFGLDCVDTTKTCNGFVCV